MHPRVWDHEVPLVMSQVIQATGWRIVHTWVVAPLDVHLHVRWSSCVCPLVDYTKSDLFPYLLSSSFDLLGDDFRILSSYSRQSSFPK